MVDFQYPCINNLGAGSDDWIVGLRYPGSEFTVTRCLGIDHEWQLSSAEADTTAYKSNGLWTSALLTPIFTRSSTRPSVGKYQYAWTVNSPTFLSGDGVGWSTWGKYGIEKRNWEYEGETKSFAIYQGELKTEVGSEKHISIRNYAINIVEPPPPQEPVPQPTDDPSTFRCGEYLYVLKKRSPRISTRIPDRYHLLYEWISLWNGAWGAINFEESLIELEELAESGDASEGDRGVVEPADPPTTRPEPRNDNYQVDVFVYPLSGNPNDEQNESSIGQGSTSWGATSTAIQYHYNIVVATGDPNNPRVYDVGGAFINTFSNVVINETFLNQYCPVPEPLPPPPPPPPPPPNDPPPDPDDPADPLITGYEVFYGYFISERSVPVRDENGNLIGTNSEVIAEASGLGEYILRSGGGGIANPPNLPYRDFDVSRVFYDSILGFTAGRPTQARERQSSEPIASLFVAYYIILLPNLIPEFLEVDIISYPISPLPVVHRVKIFAEYERRPIYDFRSENPPVPPPPNAKINGSGSDRIEITGKTFVLDTITADSTYIETASYIIDNFTGYKLTAKNIAKSCELLQLQGINAMLAIETKMTEVFADEFNSNAQTTSQYYLTSESGKQKINTLSTFLSNSNSALTLSEDTTIINFGTFMTIAKRLYAGLEDAEPKYSPNPFFTKLIGTEVAIAQNGDDFSWLARGSISNINGSQDDNNYNITSLTISVSNIEKVGFTAFGTENGVAWCDNGSFLNVVIFANGDFGYIDSTALEYLEKPLKNIGQLNLIDNILYISRNPKSDEQRNQVEKWQFTSGSGDSLNLSQAEDTEDNIFPYDSGQTLLSTSYFKEGEG